MFRRPPAAPPRGRGCGNSLRLPAPGARWHPWWCRPGRVRRTGCRWAARALGGLYHGLLTGGAAALSPPQGSSPRRWARSRGPASRGWAPGRKGLAVRRIALRGSCEGELGRTVGSWEEELGGSWLLGARRTPRVPGWAGVCHRAGAVPGFYIGIGEGLPLQVAPKPVWRSARLGQGQEPPAWPRNWRLCLIDRIPPRGEWLRCQVKWAGCRHNSIFTEIVPQKPPRVQWGWAKSRRAPQQPLRFVLFLIYQGVV